MLNKNIFVFCGGLLLLIFGFVVSSDAIERINCPATIHVQATAPSGFQRYQVPGSDVLSSVRSASINSGQLRCRYNHPTVHIQWPLGGATYTCTDNGGSQYTCQDAQPGRRTNRTVVVNCPPSLAEQATDLPRSWQASPAANVSLTGSGSDTRTANDIVFCHFESGTSPSLETYQNTPSGRSCSTSGNGFDCRRN